jgi:hypothetical protein
MGRRRMLYDQTVKDFVTDAYQLVSASSPTVPLYGNDMEKGVRFFNELLKFYSSSSLLLTIAQKVNFTIQIGQLFTTFGDPTYVPTPNVTVGRLSNLENAWLELDGVDYPLINESRNVFFGSYKYFPQLGLPRFVIITNDLNLTTMQFYPGPSQQYNVWVYGKFELPYLSESSNLSFLPFYSYKFFKLALARELAFYKGRSSAWDQKLEGMYQEARDEMESVSTMNLVIDSANESYLNGSWRLRAGI